MDAGNLPVAAEPLGLLEVVLEVELLTLGRSWGFSSVGLRELDEDAEASLGRD